MSTQHDDWITLLKQYWDCFWLRTEQDVDAAEGELQQRFKNLHAWEIVEAVRWLAGPDNKQKKCPTLRELCIAIGVLRKQARQRNEAPIDGEECTCNHGWVEYRPDAEHPDYISAVPCRCGRGRWNMSNANPYNGMDEVDLARVKRAQDIAFGQIGDQP